MKAYYETVIRTSKGKTTPIAFIGEWDGEKFVGTSEDGLEIIVRKKEYVTIVNEEAEQEIKELREELEDSYWEGYSNGFHSSYDDSVDYFKNKEK